MNKSNLISSIIIAISIIIAAALHAHMTSSSYQIAMGNDLISTALLDSKTGQVWLLANKDSSMNFKHYFPGWYRVPNMELK